MPAQYERIEACIEDVALLLMKWEQVSLSPKTFSVKEHGIFYKHLFSIDLKYCILSSCLKKEYFLIGD